MVTSTEGVQKSTRLDASAKAAEARLLEARIAEERERLERLQARQIEVSIRDEKALEEADKYVFANTFKERLVEHPSEWPGFHGYHVLGEGREVTGY